MLRLKVNKRSYEIPEELDPATPLLWVLRDNLGLLGTKYGCGAGYCGACTVHLNGKPARSCTISALAVAQSEITTIEGLSGEGLSGDDDALHPLQKAWIEHDVPQCGYCQSGQLMSAAALLKAKPRPTNADIDAAMRGNLCRCGTYQRMRAAIHSAALSRAGGHHEQSGGGQHEQS